MNARRLSYLKNAGASAALEIARQDVLADIYTSGAYFNFSVNSRVSTWLNVLAISAQLTVLICQCVLRVTPGTL